MIINSNTQTQSLNFNTQKTSTLTTNTSTSLSSNEPEITYRNDYTSDLSILSEKIGNEYYAQAVEIDKTFDDPAQHIYDKYKNEDSPYFRSDLTEQDRIIAYRNESAYLDSGDASSTFLDPFVKEIIGEIRYYEEAAVEIAFNREEVNGQFAQLLENNNITIPNDIKLSFTIDPYTSKVKISGTDDTQLISSIESIMDDENGEQLFYHIMQSSSYDNTQFTDEKEGKLSIYNDIKRETGYNLNELEVVDGKFVTPDGIDIALLFKQAINDRTDFEEEWIKPFIIGDMYDKLEDLAEKGFDSIPDLVLTIDYENGSFRDVGQSQGYGTGDTDWIVNKAASIQLDKISGQIEELLEKDNIAIPKDTKLTFTINSDSSKVEVNGTDDNKLKSLLEALLNEENAKELFLYILLDKKDTQLTPEMLEDVFKNGFNLMNGQNLSIDFENGTFSELRGDTGWIDKLTEAKSSVNIYA